MEALKNLKVRSENCERMSEKLLAELNSAVKEIFEILQDNNLTDNLRIFDFKNFGFRSEIYPKYKGYFCKIIEAYDPMDSLSPLPDRTFYFNEKSDFVGFYMSRNEVLTACEILGDFVENMINVINGLESKQTKQLEKFLKLKEV